MDKAGNKSDFDNLTVGDFLSEIQYYRVKRKDRNGALLTNERGLDIKVSPTIIEEGMFSAQQAQEEIAITRTEMIAILKDAGETVFTVNFHKQPKAKDLMAIFNDPSKQVKTQVAMTNLIKGEERTMIGYLRGLDANGTGRFSVKDLEDTKNDYPKQVDPRTLNWIILRNIKYVLK